MTSESKDALPIDLNDDSSLFKEWSKLSDSLNPANEAAEESNKQFEDDSAQSSNEIIKDIFVSSRIEEEKRENKANEDIEIERIEHEQYEFDHFIRKRVKTAKLENVRAPKKHKHKEKLENSNESVEEQSQGSINSESRHVNIDIDSNLQNQTIPEDFQRNAATNIEVVTKIKPIYESKCIETAKVKGKRKMGPFDFDSLNSNAIGTAISSLTSKFRRRNVKNEKLTEDRQKEIGTMTPGIERRYLKTPTKQPILIDAGNMTSKLVLKHPKKIELNPQPKVEAAGSTLCKNFEWKYSDRPVGKEVQVDEKYSNLSADFEWKYQNRPVGKSIQVEDKTSDLITNFEWKYPNRPVAKEVQVEEKYSNMSANFEWKYQNRPIGKGIQVELKRSSLSANFEWKYPDRPVPQIQENPVNAKPIEHLERQHSDELFDKEENNGNSKRTNRKSIDDKTSDILLPFTFDGTLDKTERSNRTSKNNVKLLKDDQIKEVYTKKGREPKTLSVNIGRSKMGEELLNSSKLLPTLDDEARRTVLATFHNHRFNQ